VNIIGVDLGVRKVGLAMFSGQDLISAYAFEADSNITRDLQLGEVAGFVHDFALMHEADAVWIEDTIIGNNRKYSIRLAECKGAVMASLSRMRPGLDVRLVDNKAWKKKVVGNGNASKDQVRDYIDVTHPAYAPLCEGDQDLYDACCVALYGLQITEQAAHLQL
jgi:Holliday junction resolvasome RuvABC endonuclease subunit